MSRTKRQVFTICKRGRISLLLGVMSILLFIIIYILLVFKTKETYFYSFFFNNITNNILLMGLAIMHVSLLGVGILLLIIAFFIKSHLIKIYPDRFELSDFLSIKKIIYFKEIKKITQQIILLQKFDMFTYSSQKLTLIFFDNPTYSFYLSYSTNEYSDNIKVIRKTEINNNNEKNFLNRNCKVEKHIIKNILKLISKSNLGLTIPRIL